ncbi:MAG: peptidoglycan-binding protein, partial [Chthoniobacterales bacterium]|nr:peptidoglycan-binding protein [Chthoniobacterales bacterium]
QNRTGIGGDNRTENIRDRRHRADGDNTNAHNRDRDGQRRHWHRDWDRTHHHRDWWRNHYTRFVLFCGGYYYWDAGFWFPAYGYDPYFSTYAYDAPIYGYNDLSPEQVMANVQAELSRLGYYQGAIDGAYGPQTREALLSYQQESGLPITGILDQATLESLGMY